uniref:Secreted protein n=1 Tax=Heterorhabditis bacteriophora TaxID=37862 RepID=A0A1I7X4C2_HETBA
MDLLVVNSSFLFLLLRACCGPRRRILGTVSLIQILTTFSKSAQIVHNLTQRPSLGPPTYMNTSCIVWILCVAHRASGTILSAKSIQGTSLTLQGQLTQCHLIQARTHTHYCYPPYRKVNYRKMHLFYKYTTNKKH